MVKITAVKVIKTLGNVQLVFKGFQLSTLPFRKRKDTMRERKREREKERKREREKERKRER
jgi:hypothetical protein